MTQQGFSGSLNGCDVALSYGARQDPGRFVAKLLTSEHRHFRGLYAWIKTASSWPPAIARPGKTITQQPERLSSRSWH